MDAPAVADGGSHPSTPAARRRPKILSRRGRCEWGDGEIFRVRQRDAISWATLSLTSIAFKFALSIA